MVGNDAIKTDTRLDVSVAMMTYFHEKYVAQAIESVLAQITDYSYEIVIGDDCSQDSTRDILLRYQQQYPDKIKLLFNDKNLGISANNYKIRCNCMGRYIATLSGDDYWLSDEKIQKQVAFLDANPDVFATVTSVEGIYDGTDRPFKVYPKRKYRGKYINMKMYLNGANIGTHGMLMRNIYLTEEGRQLFSLVPKASPFIDDSTECLLILQKSPIFSMDINGVAYRVQKNKVTAKNYNSSNSAFEKCKKVVDLYNFLNDEFVPHVDFLRIYVSKVAQALLCVLPKLEKDQFKAIYSTVPNEYKRRGLFVRAILRTFSIGCAAILRRIIKKLY